MVAVVANDVVVEDVVARAVVVEDAGAGNVVVVDVVLEETEFP